ncbi:hypothetical protein V2J09_016651 [Rumex salicifolius]
MNILRKESSLLPHFEVVEKVNDYTCYYCLNKKRSIRSLIINGINQDDEDLYFFEYLNSIKLKMGVDVMLLRNIEQSSRLCNGTRLVVTRLMTHTIEAVTISGMHIHYVYLLCQLSS